MGVFDINGLKKANDDFGHEYGDRLIVDAAVALCAAFGRENTYRIGGDEFVTILELVSSSGIDNLLQRFEDKIGEVNKGRREPMFLAKGMSCLNRETDREYKEVKEVAFLHE